MAKQTGVPKETEGITEEVVIPVIAEEITVQTHQVARAKVHVHKRVETREEVVDAPIVHEEVVTDRIPINRLLEDEVPETRHEGDVLVIPVIEEVLVTEKRLLLREEVRVSKRRTTESAAQTVTLRREVVNNERIELDTRRPATSLSVNHDFRWRRKWHLILWNSPAAF